MRSLRRRRTVTMMETLYELRTDSGFCRLFDFFEEANAKMAELIESGRFRKNDLYITRVVTE